MVRGYNKVILIGTIGSPPEFRYTQEGKATCTTTLSVSTYGRDFNTGEAAEHTEWFRLLLLDNLAERMQKFCNKGGFIHVEGSLQTRPYADRNGVVRTAVEVAVADFMMLRDNTRQEQQAQPLVHREGGAEVIEQFPLRVRQPQAAQEYVPQVATGMPILDAAMQARDESRNPVVRKTPKPRVRRTAQ